ncbi:hypothetical protein ACWEPI_08475 [Streptomyces sp. NPDC004262]
MTTAAHTSIVAHLKAQQAATHEAGLGDSNTDAYYETVIRIVSESPDPKATVAEIAQVLTREYNRPSSKCRQFPDWCIETGPHYDHVGQDITIASPQGDTVLDARILYLSGGTPSVCISEGDFTPTQARHAAAELRQFADKVEALAEHAEKAAS